ncbi:MAG TPA: hypothetical protein VMJ65_18380 [Solirubrobacteraceae bacterium]|nr:hypothetical protein [Solirubrobacteraceae bacterium]
MRRRLGPAALSALVALALASCGGSSGSSSDSASNGVTSKSPDQIVAAATHAVGSVDSVHVAGKVLSSGQNVTLDLNLVNGKGGKGSMSQNGLGFKIVAVGPEVYINGSSAFWTKFGGSAAAGLLSGKWLKAPASGQLSSLATLTDVQKLFSQLLSSHGKLVKGKTTTVQGQQVVAVNDTTNGGTLYVATTGKPYPIEISKTGSDGGQLVFDHFNQPVTLTAPAKAIDISQLK